MKGQSLKFEGTIPPGHEMTFVQRPADHFRPRALRVTSGAAECVIRDLRLGNYAQFTGALPAACFPPKADDTRFTFDGLHASTDATLVVYNLSAKSVHFEAELTEDPS